MTNNPFFKRVISLIKLAIEYWGKNTNMGEKDEKFWVSSERHITYGMVDLNFFTYPL